MQQLQDVAHGSPAHDDHRLLHAHLRERVEGVVDHRAVVDWQQVLVRHEREGEQPRPAPAREHYTLQRHGGQDKRRVRPDALGPTPPAWHRVIGAHEHLRARLQALPADRSS